jgi:hypothetical protein
VKTTSWKIHGILKVEIRWQSVGIGIAVEQAVLVSEHRDGKSKREGRNYEVVKMMADVARR